MINQYLIELDKQQVNAIKEGLERNIDLYSNQEQTAWFLQIEQYIEFFRGKKELNQRLLKMFSSLKRVKVKPKHK